MEEFPPKPVKLDNTVKYQVAGQEPESGGLKPVQLRTFTLQMGVMMSSGVPIDKALETIAETGSGAMSAAGREILLKITHGHSLSEAMAGMAWAFPKPYVASVEAGERSGRLIHCLFRLNASLERGETLRSKVRQAFAYPAAVTAVSGGLIAFLLYYMFPKFADVFAQSDQPLPFLTKFILGLSSNVAIPLLLLLVLTNLFVAVYSAKDETFLWRVRAFLIYDTPILGTINRKVAISEVCHELAGIVEAGLPLATALRLLAEAPRGDIRLSRALSRSYKAVRAGTGFAESLRGEAVIPSLIPSILMVAAETGRMAEWLEWIGKILEMEAEASVNTMVDFLEPIILAALGACVALITLAAFLPIYQIVSVQF